jgi:putative membrane protein
VAAAFQEAAARGQAVADGPQAEEPAEAGKNMGTFQKIKKINEERIEKAISDFEKSVDFEFIPVISEKSSYVGHITWILSLLLMILFFGLIDYVFSTALHDSWMSRKPFYIAVPFIAFLLGWLLDKSDLVDRFFIPASERARQVHEKAELVFFRKRLHEVKSRNALLLYISVMERQIVLFPDPSMKFEKIKEINEQLLAQLQASFKKSDYEEGLILAIEFLKKSLMPHFSKGQETGNNYPNKLIWWQS